MTDSLRFTIMAQELDRLHLSNAELRQRVERLEAAMKRLDGLHIVMPREGEFFTWTPIPAFEERQPEVVP